MKFRLISVSLIFVVLFSVLGITAVRSQVWVPTLPPWPETVRLEATSIGGNAYVEVEMTFPTGGYDVNWGSVTRIDDFTFLADAEIWMWTGPVILVIIDVSHVYDLGALPPGTYEFIFKTWGTPIKSLYFEHSTGLDVEFKLETLYKVCLDTSLYLEEGSKLVVKFYSWTKVYQAGSVFENVTPPENVVKFDNVPHPQAMAVEKAMLVLTGENTENVISTIATFTADRNVLNGRLVEIYILWALAPPPPKSVLFAEIGDIYMQWPFAPQ